MTNKKQFAASETGALREALGTPYFRQLPLEALAAGAVSLEYGAEKYAHRNWEKGLPWQQMIDSTRRHLDAIERREEMDCGSDGSGLPHYCMLMASTIMLVASMARGVGQDDRLPVPDEKALSPKQAAKWMKKTLQDAKEWRDNEFGN